ncbi:MAG TPA: HlyD family efflux transporter periplasmic adaptor subunit [Candidatus Acidoferrales bacterium]|nr:HlyD family efflux transporter periplasmic adaptor subunit [Candidatus Acidoferrales bacterium]
MKLRLYQVASLLIALSACNRPTPTVTHAAQPAPADSPRVAREVRVTGIVEAVHSTKILVPQIYGQNSQMTLTRIIPNGTKVEEGALVAVFDSTQQADQARDAKAKFEDLGHQVEQKVASNRADAEKRAADLRQAEADLAKAEIELQKGPILSEIDRQKNEIKAEIAKVHVDSLKKSNVAHDRSDAAALRILELQRDRQKVMLDRTQSNMAKLEVHTKIAGMVAHANLWRNNSMGHPQEGDQFYRGQALLSIFDPSEMRVRCAVGEPDGAALVPGAKAVVYFDAYPELAIPAHFEFASPVASSALGSPIKTFTAVFKLDKPDPHLMPDLSAAVVVEPPPSPDRSPVTAAAVPPSKGPSR